MKTTVCTLLGLWKGIFFVCLPCGITRKKIHIKVAQISFGFKTTEKFELFLSEKCYELSILKDTQNLTRQSPEQHDLY